LAAPAVTASLLRDWHRHNIDGARDTWEATSSEVDATVVSRVLEKTRDVFVERMESLLDSGDVTDLVAADPAKAIRLFRDIAATCREFGGRLDSPQPASCNPPEDGKVLSLAERIAALKAQSALR
jgi:hypothetical protein